MICLTLFLALHSFVTLWMKELCLKLSIDRNHLFAHSHSVETPLLFLKCRLTRALNAEENLKKSLVLLIPSWETKRFLPVHISCLQIIFVTLWKGIVNLILTVFSRHNLCNLSHFWHLFVFDLSWDTSFGGRASS